MRHFLAITQGTLLWQPNNFGSHLLTSNINYLNFLPWRSTTDQTNREAVFRILHVHGNNLATWFTHVVSFSPVTAEFTTSECVH